MANWIRFSTKDAEKNIVMDLQQQVWFLRNFYGNADVMKESFREQSIDKVIKQVSQSAGWLLITRAGSKRLFAEV